MAEKREMVREAPHSWCKLCMSNGEEKNGCKHSVGRPRECQMNVHEGDTRILYFIAQEGPRGKGRLP